MVSTVFCQNELFKGDKSRLAHNISIAFRFDKYEGTCTLQFIFLEIMYFSLSANELREYVISHTWEDQRIKKTETPIVFEKNQVDISHPQISWSIYSILKGSVSPSPEPDRHV